MHRREVIRRPQQDLNPRHARRHRDLIESFHRVVDENGILPLAGQRGHATADASAPTRLTGSRISRCYGPKTGRFSESFLCGYSRTLCAIGSSVPHRIPGHLAAPGSITGIRRVSTDHAPKQLEQTIKAHPRGNYSLDLHDVKPVCGDGRCSQFFSVVCPQVATESRIKARIRKSERFAAAGGGVTLRSVPHKSSVGELK